MHSSPLHRTKFLHIFAGKSLSSIAAMVGVLGFMLSLIVALVMSQGNLGMLAVWIAAAFAIAAFMRFHRKWRDTFDRIYAMKPAQTVLAARKDWRWNVEDVVFRDFPHESVSFGK